MKTQFKNKRAFTLIELLIVIAIIGILFIVLVSKVDFATDKAKATGVQTDFRSFQVALNTVAKENAGFNTFGFNTGDNAGAIPSGYAFETEALKDATIGDGIRNSYDQGDKNLNGKQDTGEVFTGRKIYTETWTEIYTLVKSGTTGLDATAVFALESAINANLDPKLHITIASDGKITMANQARDSWKNEYHGVYISNAERDNGADRGAIIIYSNGANGKWGSAHDITNGVVSVTVPGNNVNGKDDYSIVSCYTFTNGYGEVLNMSTGFSNNQSFNGNTTNAPAAVPGNGGNAGGSEPSLPTPKLDGTVANSVSPIAYEWSELKDLAQAKFSVDVLRNTYGIEVGDYKEVNGTKYVLVDLGLDAGDYDGFVFMYNSGKTNVMNSSKTNAGGYVDSKMKRYLDDGNDDNDEDLYDKLDSDLKSVLKKVTITCNSGYLDKDGTNTNGTSTHTTDVHLFLASSKEVGFTVSGYKYNAEGTCFDLFTSEASSRAGFISTANIPSSSIWWLRSAYSNSTSGFLSAYTSCGILDANLVCVVVPAFVIG